MKALDIFCGAAGGWSLGLERAGIETVAACEIDPWRREVFAVNHPGCRMYDDVRSLDAGRLMADLGCLPDIVVGSPPCQEISAANSKGEGITDDHLFWEWARLVFEIRPLWCAAENSPRARTTGIDGILDALAQARYAFWPLVVGADNAGANHWRKRLWLIAADAERIGIREQPGRGARTDGRVAALARLDTPEWQSGSRSQELHPDAASRGCDARPRPNLAFAESPDVHPDASRTSVRAGWGLACSREADASYDPHADCEGQHGRPGHGEMAGAWTHLMLATPRASDAEKGSPRQTQKGTAMTPSGAAMLPTPLKSDCRTPNLPRPKNDRPHRHPGIGAERADLKDRFAIMLATPTSRDLRSDRASEATMARNSRPLSEQSGSLGLVGTAASPVSQRRELLLGLVLWMMGQKPSWLLACATVPSRRSVTPSSRRSPKPSPAPPGAS